MRKVIFTLFVTFLVSSPTLARKLEKIEVAKGYDENNTIHAPVLDATDVVPIRFETFDNQISPDSLVLRRGQRYRGGVNASLGPKVDLATSLRETLENEAESMGLPLGDGGWIVKGNLIDLHIINTMPSTWSMGVVLFFGYVHLDLELTSPTGKRETVALHLYNYGVRGGGSGKAIFNKGFANVLIETARDTLAHLNREYFRVKPAPSILNAITELDVHKIAQQEAAICAIGLSGSAAAVPKLIELLDSDDYGPRTAVILALARIGLPDTVAPLAKKYAQFDDDGRWFTLRAMAYIGTHDALAMVRQQGLKDTELYPRQLAEAIIKVTDQVSPTNE